MNSLTSQRVQLQPGYVLHQRPYRDTSRILEVFTRDHGRQTLFARGVRGSKTGLAAALQAFQPLLLSWSSKSDAGTLSAAEMHDEPQSLPASRLMSGFYLNELLIKLLHQHDPQPEIFALYDATLHKLKAAADEAAALRRFELQLLKILGFGLTLHIEAESGTAIDPQGCYRYVLEHGPVAVEAVNDASKGVYRGESLLALAREDFANPHCKTEARHLLRTVLDRLLEGRAMQSREILGDLRRLRRT